MTGGKRTTNPTVVPGLPKVPSDLSPQAKRYLEMLTEAVEIRLGRRGDPRDAAITFRDLIDAGLASEGPLVFNNSGGTTITPVVNPNNSSTPTAPTGFQANGAFSKIILQWDYPFDQFFGYSITEIWRHTADVLGDAQLIGTATGMIFVDEVGQSASFYYWARHVNDGGIQGPFNSNAGTFAETAVDVNFMLELLTDAITEDEFAQSLKDEINLIDVIATQLYGGSIGAPSVGSVMYDLNTLQGTVGTVTNDIVSLQTVTATHTSDITALNTTVNDPSTGVNANSNAISGIQTNVTTLQGTVTANSSDITSLENAVNHPTTGLGATSQALNGLTSTVSTQGTSISSNAQNISALQSQVNHPSTGLNASSTAISNLQTTTTQQANTLSAHGVDISNNASDITTLNSTVAGQNASIQQNATTTASLQNDVVSLNAEYSVKVDVNGNVAGFGLASGGSPQQSRFYVAADKFAIVPAGSAPSTSTGTVPFAVVTSPTTQNGVAVPAGTYIHSAMIANGTINSAKIGNLAVDSAQIADLAVETAKIDNFAITGAKIATATITSANIQDATITTANIGTAQITTLLLDNEAVIVPRFAQGSLNNHFLTGTVTQVVGVPLSISGLPAGQSCRIAIMGVVSAYSSSTNLTNLRLHIYSGSTPHNLVGATFGAEGIAVTNFGSFLVGNGFNQTISLRVSCTSNPGGSSTKSGTSFVGKIIVMAAKR